MPLIGTRLPKGLGARALVHVLALLLLPSPALAQSPAERQSLEAWRTRVEAELGSAELRRLIDSLDGNDPLVRLRAGFGHLRLGRLTQDRGEIDRGLRAFEWATSSRTDWPYPWLGVALSHLALEYEGFGARATLLHAAGSSHFDGFANAMAEALALDPSFEPALRVLGRELSAQGDRAQPRTLLEALRSAVAAGFGDPRLRLILGRAARTEGRLEAALAEFRAYRSAGGDPAIAGIEEARTLVGLGGGTAAAATYLAGLATSGPEGRALLRRDLAWVASGDELAGFDALAPAEIQNWVRRFWDKRDAIEARAPGERLAEHLRRWLHVHRHFRVVSPERRTQYARLMAVSVGPCADGGPASLDDYEFQDPARLQDLRRRERLLDHRAMIYMRHGEPHRRVGTAIVERPTGAEEEPQAEVALPAAAAPEADREMEPLPPLPEPLDAYREGGELDKSTNQSWLYWFEGEQRAFHFFGSMALGRGPTTLVSTLPLDPRILRSRGVLDSRYGKLAFRAEYAHSRVYRGAALNCAIPAQELRAEGRADIQAAVTSDSYTRFYPRALDGVLQVYGLTRGAESGSALVVYAVRLDSLATARLVDAAGASRLRLRIGAVSRKGTIVRVDTVRVARVPSHRRDDYLIGMIEIPVPAGTYTVTISASDSSGWTGLSGRYLDIPVHAVSGGLDASDLVLGREGSGLEWLGEAPPVPLNPLGAYRRGASVEVYYRLLGLRPAEPYRTTVEVREADDPDGKPRIALAFDDRAESSQAAVRRTIGLARLSQGRYVLRITVRDGEGRSVRREQRLVVVK